MLILGIETSCDETAASVVKDGTEILSSVIASSEEIHQKYGGIIPEQAAREQIRSIMPVIEEALENSKFKIKNEKLKFKIQNYKNFIDAVAVTVGPGLIGSLLVGVETAKTLAWVWNKPIVPVNHLTAHLYANFLELQSGKAAKLQKSKLPTTNYQLLTTIFPAICLIVSGGHTELVLMKDHGKFTWLGGTRDDAAGECFDKCARLLGLGYPGGPAIAAEAARIKNYELRIMNKMKLPRPMLDQENFDFSFSGLKTAAIHLLKKSNNQQSTINNQQFFAYEIQEAITDILVKKTLKAAEKYKVKSILLGGGVAANSRLREKFQSSITHYPLPINLLIPDKNLCTDNAAIIASAAYFNYQPVPWSKIKANPSLTIECDFSHVPKSL